MKPTDPRLWLSIASLAIVIVIVLLDLERATPGALTPVHARLPELAGAAGCDACHGRGDEDMAQACSVCHAAIGEQLATASGFHGSLAPDLAAACAVCHVEHHGEELALVGEHAFRRAGFASRDAFDHAHVPFALVGAHADLDCEACHANADVAWLAAGEQRFLGASQTCASCHSDPHEGRYSSSCETCHGQEHPFAAVASFEHGDAFPLTGAHGRATCAACHPDEGPHAIGALALHGASASRACADCHDSPHAEPFLAAVASVSGVASGASCAACHSAEHDSFASGATMTPAQHALTGFPLAAPHAGLDCAACHAREQGRDFAARHPGRSPSDCAACHADPHGGQFAAGGTSAFAGAACADCHADGAFSPHAFGSAAHARTAFPLTGAHLAADCADCHTRPHPDVAGVVFASADVHCAACHDDAHLGALATPDGTAGADCAACHTTERFDAVVRAAFDHDCTRFGLDGAHAGLDCEACHVPSDVADAFGRTFGRIPPPPAGGYASCAGCHGDAHRGAFDGPRVEAAALHLAGDRAGCARCHTTAAFDDLVPGAFDHGAWTGFALDGAHDAIACAACHGTLAGTGGATGGAAGGATAARTLGFVADHVAGDTSRCASCHADVHGGAFDGPTTPTTVDGRADCARCHTTASFRAAALVDFDHALWTGFALDGAHAAVACASCHAVPRPGAAPGALGLVRGSDCADCHADPHVGQFADAGRTDCARCHTSTAAFTVPGFDHTRDTRFALDAQHARLACSACHTAQPLADGGSAVRYRPLGTSCIDCHADDLGGGR